MATPAVSPSPAAPTPPAEQTLDSHMLPAEPSPAVAPRSARPLSAATSSATTTTTTATTTTTTTTTTTPPSSPPPAADAHVHPPDMFSLLGGALATVHPPRRPQRARPASGLRLSFDLLGIGPPHPDRFGSLSFHDTTPDNGALDLTTADEDATLLDSNVPNAMQTLDLVSSMPTKPRLHPGLIQTPYRHDVATLTPPADAEPSWRATTLKHLSDAPGDSRSPDLPDLPAQASSIAAVRNAGERTVTVASEANVRSNSDDESTAWIDGALEVLVDNIRSAAIPNNPLRVLSHALPVPSDSGHIYNTILERIGANTPCNPPTWINVFHAIPGKFNLPDIPTSPPSTPGMQSGDDYFTQKIFSSAVPISDYQDDPSALPRSPRPVVPPSTVNLAVVERYIPPSSSNEFKNLFSPSGPSLLVDRLVELSPTGGTLVFIYPTRTGAETFMREYLSPILDPLLRTTQVVHGLSWSLSQDLGTMAATKDMDEFDQMQRSMQRLCARLAQRKQGSYATVHASKACVRIGRAAWAKDWWPRQEYPRIKETVTRATQEALRKSSNQYIERASTATELVGHLVEGVLKNQYPSGQDPTSGIEVGIFVVQRSA